jgi:tRNA(Arg) A34 adenosine deaminase TadA
MTRTEMIAHLLAAGEVAREAVAHGHHPFGAVLVGPDDRILMRQGNIDTLRHAETELCRRAAAAYPAAFLWTCTLVSTGEPWPCAPVHSIGQISAAWSMVSRRRSSSRRPATTPRTRP